MDDCVFCNIKNKVIEASLVYEDEELFVIKDILPKAPVHFLVIPKEHLPSLNDLAPSREALVGKMIMLAKRLAAEHKVAESGYKLVFNVGKHGGQSVPHLHLHVLGGKQLQE